MHTSRYMYMYGHACMHIQPFRMILFVDSQANKLEESLSKYFGPSQPIAEDGECVVSMAVM